MQNGFDTVPSQIRETQSNFNLISTDILLGLCELLNIYGEFLFNQKSTNLPIMPDASREMALQKIFSSKTEKMAAFNHFAQVPPGTWIDMDGLRGFADDIVYRLWA